MRLRKKLISRGSEFVKAVGGVFNDPGKLHQQINQSHSFYERKQLM